MLKLLIATMSMMFVSMWEVVQFFLFVLSFFFLKCGHDFFSLRAWVYDGYGLLKFCFNFAEDLSCWFNGLL